MPGGCCVCVYSRGLGLVGGNSIFPQGGYIIDFHTNQVEKPKKDILIIIPEWKNQVKIGKKITSLFTPVIFQTIDFVQ